MFGKRKSKAPKLLYCSFCGKDSNTVKALISGPAVLICDECVGLCNKILAGERPPEPITTPDNLPADHLLKTLSASAALAGSASEFLRRRVAVLRRRGVKWASIGKALGVSRQAAWERFS